MEEARIRKTPFGGSQLYLNGYTYYQNSKSNGRTYWRCTQFRKGSGCYGSAITSGNCHVLKEGIHTHSPIYDDHDEHEEDSEIEVDDDGDEIDGDNEDAVEDDDMESSSSDEPESDTDTDLKWEPWVEKSDVAEMITYDHEYGQQDAVLDDEDEQQDDDGEQEDSDEEEYERVSPSSRAKKHKNVLRILKEERASLREAILSSADKDAVCFLCEICNNIKRGYYSNFNKKERCLLLAIADDMSLLADPDITWIQKRNYLIEHAREPFLPVLLNTIHHSLGI